MIANLMGDVRYSLRQLRKTAGFTMTAVLTLALGIGANTAIFTLVHAVLLKNLPVVDPKSLVRLGDKEDCCNMGLTSFESDYTTFSYEGYKYLRDHTPEFEELAAMQAGSADLSVRRALVDTSSQSSLGEFVSGNYFQTFGIQPLIGRVLTPSDDREGAQPVAVMSYRAWQRDYAGDPSVIGSAFFMNTHPLTIIGVTPEAFYGDRMSERPPDFFLPISQEPALGFYAARNNPDLGWLYLIGRVKPGTTMGPLQAKVSALLRQSLSQLPPYQSEHGKEHLAKAHVVLTPGGVGVANMQHNAANSLYLLTGLSGLVLLIACANIANLMLVRGTGDGVLRSRFAWLSAQRGTTRAPNDDREHYVGTPRRPGWIGAGVRRDARTAGADVPGFAHAVDPCGAVAARAEFCFRHLSAYRTCLRHCAGLDHLAGAARQCDARDQSNHEGRLLVAATITRDPAGGVVAGAAGRSRTARQEPEQTRASGIRPGNRPTGSSST